MKHLSKFILIISLISLTHQADANRDRITKKKINGGTFYLVDDKKDRKEIEKTKVVATENLISSSEIKSEQVFTTLDSYLTPVKIDITTAAALAPQMLVNIADVSEKTTIAAIESQKRTLQENKNQDIVEKAKDTEVKTENKVKAKTKKFLAKEGDPSKNWAGITSMICGLVSFFVFGIPLGILAVVFGAIGLRSQRRGMAITGIIIGIIGISIILIALAAV